MRTSLIVAMARNGVIGLKGALPWRLPDDMAFFKRVTLGHHVVMGRKTWESLRRPLVDRTNIVVTRQRDYRAPGAQIVPSVRAAMDLAASAREQEIFVIGGAEIYALALPCAQRIYLTRVEAEVEGDTWLPPLDEGWIEVSRQEHPADERHPFDFAICVLERSAVSPAPR